MASLAIQSGGPSRSAVTKQSVHILPVTLGALVLAGSSGGHYFPPGGDSPPVFAHSSSSSVNDEIFEPVSLKAGISNVQPMTGIVFWADNVSALDALADHAVQLEFSYLLFSDVVTRKGEYRWRVVDDLLEEIAARKHQAILRFRFSYPGQTAVSVPAYITRLPGYRLTFAEVEGRDTFLPDWRIRELELFTLDFFRVFAQRYDKDRRLALLQVGFGSYGEYHLFKGPPRLGKNFPSKRFQARFLKAMDEFFQNKQWAISIDAANPRYSPFATQVELKEVGFGLFDDSLMHEKHSRHESEYNRASWLFFGEQRWHGSMAGGELSYYTDYDQQNALSLPDGPHGRDFESFVEQYHLSYVMGNDQLRYHSVARVKQAAMRTGYAFTVTRFESNGVETRISIRNDGVAPIYYDAYPALDKVKSNKSLKGLLPGRTRSSVIEADARSSSLSIVSDHILDSQEIQFNASL